MNDNTTCHCEDDNGYQLELYRSNKLGGVYTVRLDERLTLLYGNDLYFNLYEYTPEELLQKSTALFIHPDDFAKLQETVRCAKEKNEKTFEIEKRIITKSKKVKYTLVRGTFNVRNSEEVLEGYVTDITRQKNIENKLKKSQEELSTFISNVPGGVFQYGAYSDNFEFVSENMLAMLGYTQEEFDQKFNNKFSNMIYVEDRERVIKEIFDQVSILTIPLFSMNTETQFMRTVWVKM